MQFFIRMLFLFSIILTLCNRASHADKMDEEWQRVYLATYPGSGNHWMRYLIEEATHIVTGSVYRDVGPMRGFGYEYKGVEHSKTPLPWGFAPENGYRGDCRYPNPGEPVIIKTHFPVHPRSKYDSHSTVKNIKIVRYPLDSIYSLFKGCKSVSKTKDGKIPSHFAKDSALQWKKFEKHWEEKGNVLTIRFEDLYEKPHETLRQVLDAIGYCNVNEEDINRAVERYPPTGGIYKCQQDPSSYYAEDLEFIANELGPITGKYGYELHLGKDDPFRWPTLPQFSLF